MGKNQLQEVLRLNDLWLAGDPTGKRANLSQADLSGANLSLADLSRANLSGANLSGANLSRANLSRAKRKGFMLLRRPPIQALGGEYPALVFPTHVEVGCRTWSLEAFKALEGDAEAGHFDAGKALILAAIAYLEASA